MSDHKKCPICESPVLECDDGFSCLECDTEFSQVGESAYLINHVGNYSVSELLEAVQHMIVPHQWTLKF